MFHPTTGSIYDVVGFEKKKQKKNLLNFFEVAQTMKSNLKFGVFLVKLEVKDLKTATYPVA